MISVFDQVVIAYFVADLLTSLYHLATDRGWNTPRVCANFEKHHDMPESMTFDLEPMLAGVPLLAFGCYLASPFVALLGLFISFAQVPHYFTHHPAPFYVVRLQQWRLFIPPASHHLHHRGFDRNFSVINGWSNPMVNWILDKAGL